MLKSQDKYFSKYLYLTVSAEDGFGYIWLEVIHLKLSICQKQILLFRPPPLPHAHINIRINCRISFKQLTMNMEPAKPYYY
jgi:hypothetical protein